jgi:hypothetical protein
MQNPEETMYPQIPQIPPYNDHTTPLAYPPQPARKARWAVIGAYIVGALGLTAAGVSLYLFLSYKSSAAAQLGQMRQQVSQANQALADERSQAANTYNALYTKINSVSSLAPYGMVCSQYFTSPNGGPATYWIPCTDRRP